MLPRKTHRVPRWTLAAIAMGLALPAARTTAQEAPSPAQQRLRADVGYLADDAREGRGPGTKGIEAAAAYIADEFKKAGLKPAPGADGYFQPFTLGGEGTLGEPTRLAVAGGEGKALEASPKADFSPLAIGKGGKLEGVPLAFAGYGITHKDEEKDLDYDDYKDIDVKDKAVLVLRRSPRYGTDEGLFGGARPGSHASFLHKATNAAKHGARAVLMVNDLSGLKGAKDELLDFRAAGPRRTPIPFLMVSREFADKVLAAAGAPSLKDLEARIGEDLKPQSRDLGPLKVDAEVVIEPLRTKNVIGVLEGSGPLADETIVVGAHYDHLGRGDFGSLAFGSTEIHNGADDNASGTATVIEMARRLAARKDPLPRRVVFMAFSGEERGLLGSAYYVAHPLYPLKNTVMMVNFDMVGRLNDKSMLMIYGTGTTPGLDAIVDALGKAEGFSVRKFADGRGGGDARYFAASDHFSFYRKDIPVLFFFTGVHADYHRPTDDTELINFPGMARVADFGELLLLDLARRPKRPEFSRNAATSVASNPHGDGATAADAEEHGDSRRSAYLGAVPDYGGEDDGKGVRLSDVTEGSPAARGGLKKTDVLVRIGDAEIGNLEDYAAALQAHKPGDKVKVVVLRDGKETPLDVTLGSRGSSRR